METPPTPTRTVCANCGADRTVPTYAADPGPCACGCSIRVTEALLGVVAPQLPLPTIGMADLGQQACDECGGSGNWTGWSGDDEQTQEDGCPGCDGTGKSR